MLYYHAFACMCISRYICVYFCGMLLFKKNSCYFVMVFALTRMNGQYKSFMKDRGMADYVKQGNQGVPYPKPSSRALRNSCFSLVDQMQWGFHRVWNSCFLCFHNHLESL